MAANAIHPILSLSDIIHPLSPSPGPSSTEMVSEQQLDPSGISNEAEEPLLEAQLTRMRGRVAEMGLLHPEPLTATQRERELAQMVVKLAESIRPDQSQLVTQAETISDLKNERIFILDQIQEERRRWESEREGWARSVEALLSQKARQLQDQDGDRHLQSKLSHLETENRSLRDKLEDALMRLSTLESEISKLKPILLLQPFPSNNQPLTLSSLSHASSFLASLAYPAVSGAVALASEKVRREKKPKKEKEQKVPPPALPTLGTPTAVPGQDSAPKESSTSPGDNTPKPQTQARPQTPKLTSAVQTTPPTASGSSSSYYRSAPSSTSHQPYLHLFPQSASTPGAGPSTASPQRGVTASPERKVKVRSSRMPPPVPLMSDARNEHLLLAARKIGRERVATMTGIILSEQQHQQEEKEKDRVRPTSHYRSDDASTASPKTPKRGTTQTHGQRSPRFLFMHGSGASGSSTTGFNQMHTPAGDAGVKSSSKGKSSRQQGEPTPLDNLASAARMLNPDGSPTSSPTQSGNVRRRRQRDVFENDIFESPLQKKRRTMLANSSLSVDGGVRAGSSSSNRTSAALGSTGASGGSRSALDVLADTAASSRSTRGSGKHTNTSSAARGGKGKGKQREAASHASDEDVEMQADVHGSEPSWTGDERGASESPTMGKSKTGRRSSRRTQSLRSGGTGRGRNPPLPRVISRPSGNDAESASLAPRRRPVTPISTGHSSTRFSVVAGDGRNIPPGSELSDVDVDPDERDVESEDGDARRSQFRQSSISETIQSTQQSGEAQQVAQGLAPPIFLDSSGHS